MRIGVPKEVKANELRVGLTVAAVRELVELGHELIVENNAGIGIGCSNQNYQAVGAKIAPSASDVYSTAQLIIKVKEPTLAECKYLQSHHTLFTFLHLAAIPEVTNELLNIGLIAIAYETITDASGRLPILAPMSEIAGRMAVQSGSRALEKFYGGKGILLGGIPGVNRSNVVILGAGVAGTNALQIAVGMGAKVAILDINQDKLRFIDSIYGSQVETIYASLSNIATWVQLADLLIGAILVPGAKAPHIVTEDIVQSMAEGSVIVDVSIDQGGCIATSKATTHDDPIFIKHGVLHYCVSNIPSAVAKTATYGLNNITLGYIKELVAYNDPLAACRKNKHLADGLNIVAGNICHATVANALGKKHISWHNQ